MNQGHLTETLKRLQHVVLDMDGTIYLGDAVFEATQPFLDTLTRHRIGYTFVTNNNSRSRADYIHHLSQLGLEIAPESLFTSAHGTVAYLSAKLPEIRRVFVLGMPGLVEDLQLGGLDVTDERPEAVIVGFDRTLTYDRVAQAAYWIQQGVPYLATHPDLICPTNLPTVLPDCGAICALLEAATGRRPDAIPGKPSAEMVNGVMRHHHVMPAETAMIGDRLYTDIQMALDAQVLAVLTLTGEATLEDVGESAVQPDWVINDLGVFADQLRATRGA